MSEEKMIGITPERVKADLIKQGYNLAEFSRIKGFEYQHLVDVINKHCNGSKTQIRSGKVYHMLLELSLEVGYPVNNWIEIIGNRVGSSKEGDSHVMSYLIIPQYISWEILLTEWVEKKGIIVNKCCSQRELPCLNKKDITIGILSIDDAIKIMLLGVRYFHIKFESELVNLPVDLTFDEFMSLKPKLIELNAVCTK